MEKRVMTIGAFVSIIVLGAIGLCLMGSPRGPIKDFEDEFHGEHASSGGDRIPDFVYTMRNGVIVSCTGIYSIPPSQLF